MAASRVCGVPDLTTRPAVARDLLEALRPPVQQKAGTSWMRRRDDRGVDWGTARHGGPRCQHQDDDRKNDRAEPDSRPSSWAANHVLSFHRSYLHVIQSWGRGQRKAARRWRHREYYGVGYWLFGS